MNSLEIQTEGNSRVRVVIKDSGVQASLLYDRHPTGELEFNPRNSGFVGLSCEPPINHPLRAQARTALLLNGEIVMERVN